ncbi:MAG: threonine-phosphate decarboxylase CobD [Rhizobiaceae bacterium]|nr:threonine-phosphate decarboxylase CobD [Rhizobiaceae bacterium]
MRDETFLPVEHGGSLARAAAEFPNAPKPFVDLSTGINPHHYPFFDLPASALTRLPEPSRVAELCATAAVAYGASPGTLVAGPGTQVLLPLVASLAQPGRAAILGPTYQEHARAAAIAGHEVSEVGDFDALADAGLAVVVNPNNPDGRVVERGQLIELANRLHARGGLLVVDEAFMDVGPRNESVADAVEEGGLVVLRSFGKFFGLAGVRLGFAIAAPSLAAQLAARLGPWAVAGPALEYGLRALADKGWQEGMRGRLAREAVRLDRCLANAGVAVTGGTSLFRHIATDAAARLYRHLGGRGVLLRSFADRPRELRCGLPGSEEGWRRLEAALAQWREEVR